MKNINIVLWNRPRKYIIAKFQFLYISSHPHNLVMYEILVSEPEDFHGIINLRGVLHFFETKFKYLYFLHAIETCKL